MKSDLISPTETNRYLFKRVLFQNYEFIIKGFRNNSFNDEFEEENQCDIIIDEFMTQYENIPQLETTELMGEFLKSKNLNGLNILDIESGNQGLCGLLASKCGASNVIFTCGSPSSQPSTPTFNILLTNNSTTTTTTTTNYVESIYDIEELIKINETSLSSRVVSFHFGLENLNSFFYKISIPFDYIILNNLLLKDEYKSIEKILLLFGTISSMLMIQKYHNPNHPICKCLFSIDSNSINIPIIKILDIANRFNLKNEFINIGNFNDNFKLIEFTLK
ncbi:hypothetical protein ACTFIY_002655 [Dictyostelium cf. discoideum]